MAFPGGCSRTGMNFKLLLLFFCFVLIKMELPNKVIYFPLHPPPPVYYSKTTLISLKWILIHWSRKNNQRIFHGNVITQRPKLLEPSEPGGWWSHLHLTTSVLRVRHWLCSHAQISPVPSKPRLIVNMIWCDTIYCTSARVGNKCRPVVLSLFTLCVPHILFSYHVAQCLFMSNMFSTCWKIPGCIKGGNASRWRSTSELWRLDLNRRVRGQHSE